MEEGNVMGVMDVSDGGMDGFARGVSGVQREGRGKRGSQPELREDQVREAAVVSGLLPGPFCTMVLFLSERTWFRWNGNPLRPCRESFRDPAGPCAPVE